MLSQAGVQVPKPSGRAERQVTHSSAPGSDECGECQGQSESGVPWLTPHRAPKLCRVGCGRDSNRDRSPE